MIAHTCNLHKNGVHTLETAGRYELIVNKTLFARGKAEKFVIARDDHGVYSVHDSLRRAGIRLTERYHMANL